MDFLGIGPLELLLVVVVFLVVMGPDKVPGMAKKVGTLVGQARHAVTEAKNAVMTEAEEISSSLSASESKQQAASLAAPVAVQATTKPALESDTSVAGRHGQPPMHG